MRKWIALLAWPAVAWAQNAVPTEFPAEALAVEDAALQQRLAGHVYRAQLADGATWRLDYRRNGYVYLNTGSGFSDTGKWSAQGGQMCIEWNRAPSGCLPTRATAGQVFIQRGNKEVVTLQPD